VVSPHPPIPFLDLAAQNAPLADQLQGAFARVLASNRFILGTEVSSFEREVAAFLGVDHAIGVSSGTDALLVALMALDVGPGDEVVTTPFSFFATAGSIARVGAKPVFVDIEPDTYNIDISRARAVIGPRTKAIIPVHLFGQPCDLDALEELCQKNGVFLIEDAAQAIGAGSPNRRAGGVGHFGCFSFFPSKNLGAFGDGGLVTTQNEELAKRVRLLRSHGASTKYYHALVGGNFRLDELQAAILRVKLPYLDAWTQARCANAAMYRTYFEQAGLPSDLLTLPICKYPGHIYNQYVIRTSRRDALRRYLEDSGIGTEIYYPRPLHLQDCFRTLGYEPGSLPQAETASAQVLALPIFPELGARRIARVAEQVIAFLGQQK
jgi:dTDP-4-amino-4,6-dideoxygalactose transaminase